MLERFRREMDTCSVKLYYLLQESRVRVESSGDRTCVRVEVHTQGTSTPIRQSIRGSVTPRVTTPIHTTRTKKGSSTSLRSGNGPLQTLLQNGIGLRYDVTVHTRDLQTHWGITGKGGEGVGKSDLTLRNYKCDTRFTVVTVGVDPRGIVT